MDRRDRWQLTAESFSALLAALDPAPPGTSSRERFSSASHQRHIAVERYLRLHQRLVFFFTRHCAIHPEDLADICINRLARKLADGEAIENIEGFSLGIARMVQREDQAGHLRNQLAISLWMRNESPSRSASNDEEEKLERMDRQFAALPESTRRMLAGYHLGRGTARVERRKQLADDLGISIGTLRKRVFDLQAQLRRKFGKIRHDNRQLDKGKLEQLTPAVATRSLLYPGEEPDHR